MEVMLVVLSTAIGTVVGVTAGLLMINRRSRITPTGAHLAALQKEFSAPADPAATGAAAMPGVNLEDLRKLVVDRDDALRQSHEDLQKAQVLVEQAKLEAQQEAAQRAAAEQRVQELTAQLAALLQQSGDIETRLKDHESLEARITALTTELATAQTTANEQYAAFRAAQEQVDLRTREQEALNARIAALAADLETVQSSSEKDGSYRASLEAQLTADREYIHQLTTQIGDLQRDLGNYETRLTEQRQLAAKGLEFLNQAQDNFAGVFRAFYNGNGNGAEAAYNPNGAEAPVAPVAAD